VEAVRGDGVKDTLTCLRPPDGESTTALSEAAAAVGACSVRGGGGDDSSEFLRLLNSAEQKVVLEDWAARARIYRMSDNDELRSAHAKAIGEMDALADFDTTGPPGESGRKMVLGLFAEEQIKAVAGAEVSHESGLVVTSLIVYPAELNDPDSTAAIRLIHALYLLADAISTSIDMSPVNQDGLEPSCITVRSCALNEGIDNEGSEGGGFI